MIILEHLKRRISWGKTDLIALHFLVFVLCAYQLQHIFPSYKTYFVREILYAYLYSRVLIRYLSTALYLLHNQRLFKILTFFLSMSVIIAIHTWYVTNLSVSQAGFSRFVHIALLAPLVALIVTRKSEVHSLIYTWMAVVLMGALTLFVQLLEFDMNWMLGDYVAVRGDLSRYKTLLGEPNVGGLAGVIFFIFSLWFIKNRSIKIAFIGISVFLVIFSLSKSALILFIFSIFIMFLASLWRWLSFRDLRAVSNALIGLAWAVIWFLIISLSNLGSNYISAATQATSGSDWEQHSAIADLGARVYQPTILKRMMFTEHVWDEKPDGLVVGANNHVGFINLIAFGGSFAAAGSAAVELGVAGAVAPHNGYLELFMVGGVLFLGVFVLIMSLSVTSFIKRFISKESVLGVLCFPLIILGGYMLGYPNFYEPISGTILWLAIGVACCQLESGSAAYRH